MAGKNAATLLDECRRIRDIETRRKNITEAKAQIYLAALLAMIPILISITGHDKFVTASAFKTWIEILGLAFFFMGIFSGIIAFIYAFRALHTAGYNRLSVEEICTIGKNANAIDDLIINILVTVRDDMETINKKVECIKRTQISVTFMAVFELVSLVLIVFFPLSINLIKSLKNFREINIF